MWIETRTSFSVVICFTQLVSDGELLVPRLSFTPYRIFYTMSNTALFSVKILIISVLYKHFTHFFYRLIIKKRKVLPLLLIHIIYNLSIRLVHLHSVKLNIYCRYIASYLMTERMTYHLYWYIKFSRYCRPCMT